MRNREGPEWKKAMQIGLQFEIIGVTKRQEGHAACMDLEKTNSSVDWKAVWDTLKVYGAGRKMLNRQIEVLLPFNYRQTHIDQ